MESNMKLEFQKIKIFSVIRKKYPAGRMSAMPKQAWPPRELLICGVLGTRQKDRK